MVEAAKYLSKSIAAVGQDLADGSVSSVDLTQACLDRIEATDSGEQGLNAFLEVDRDFALAAAEAADHRRQSGGRCGPLDGVPVAIKDNINVAGLGSRCASKILEGFVAPYDSTVSERLRAAGAVILGKTNMDEFGMGSSTEHSAFAPARNPHDRERVPGGSSGGSAISVAAQSSFAALGSDTGGSVRQPAAFCGVVGLKPTYGRVSRYGLIAFASSLDQVGPITRTVQDAAIVLDVIAGHDHRDATSSPQTLPQYSAGLAPPDAPLRIGVLDFSGAADGMQPAMTQAFDRAVSTLSALGHRCETVTLPHDAYAIAAYYLICTAEASSNLARFDGVRYGRRATGEKQALDLEGLYSHSRGQGFGAEVKRRIMLGTFALSSGYYDAFYGKAQQARTKICDDYRQLFDSGIDILITPTTPTSAYNLGAHSGDPLEMYLADLFTVGASLAGLPAIALPCGRDETGLPLGLHMVAAPWRELPLLCAAHQFESATAGGTNL